METKISIFFLSLLLLTLIPNITNAQQEPKAILEILADKDIYYEKGDVIQIRAFSNESVDVTLSVFWNWRSLNDNELIYQNTKVANATWNLPTANQKVGFYKIECNTSETTVTVWRTLISFSGYTPTALPFSHVWKGINYSLIGRNFKAEKQDDYIEFSYPKIPFAHATDFYTNNMTFLVRLNGLSWKVDLCYIIVHSGLKWIVNGTLENPQTFDFELAHNPLKQWKKRLDSFRSEGNLVFDWSDLRKVGEAFSWNGTSKILSVSIPESFSLDPYVFEDGFEGSYPSPWSAYQSGGTQNFTTHYSHHGSQASGHYGLTNGYCELVRSVSEIDEYYARGYVMMPVLPTQTGRRWIGFGAMRYQSNLISSGLQRFANGSYCWCIVDRTTGTTMQYDAPCSTVSADTWYCLEVYGYLAGGTSGKAALWVEGELVVNQTGIDTNNRGLANQAAVLSWLGDGAPAEPSSRIFYYDCFVLDDEYIGVEEEEGQELSFDLFENLLLYGSTLVSKGLSYTQSGLIQLYTSSFDLFDWLAMWKEYSFLSSALMRLSSSSNLGKEKGYLTGGLYAFYDSVRLGKSLSITQFANFVLGGSSAMLSQLQAAQEYLFNLFANQIVSSSLSSGKALLFSVGSVTSAFSGAAMAFEDGLLSMIVVLVGNVLVQAVVSQLGGIVVVSPPLSDMETVMVAFGLVLPWVFAALLLSKRKRDGSVS